MPKDKIIFDLIKVLIALVIIVFSSDFFDDEKLCGFKPRIAKFGFLLKTFLLHSIILKGIQN